LSDISIPGERFTLWLNSEGKPVEKPLAEMTAGEVSLALQWQQDEQRRLERIAAPWAKMAEDWSARGIQPDITEVQWREAVDALRAAAAATQKMQRLMQLLYAAIPQWHSSGLTFGAALRRFWSRR
jgi:hypothetical protein